MARDGMTQLIADLRGKTSAGTADYSLAGVTYWTDDQLQAQLDKTRREWKNRPLMADPVNVNGVNQYVDYTFPSEVGEWVEQASGGSAVWAVKDSSGATIGTANYTVNYNARMISFVTDTAGAGYTLDCHSYELDKAAGEIWRWKAAQVANRVDWQSDNHRFSASQEREACLAMAGEYERKGGARTVRVRREDLY